MTLSYELARRHYQIRRSLELDPGTRAYERIAQWLRDLPAEALVQLLEHDPETYAQLVPLCLLCSHFDGLSPERLATPALQEALATLYEDFSWPLIQELERLMHDEKLGRYPYVRSLLLQELRFHQRHVSRSLGGPFDRDRFRQYLGGYVYLLRSGLGNPFLSDAWNETGWLRRWQLELAPARQALPVQASLRNQIAKYKLSEPAKLLHAELDQALAQPEAFVQQLELSATAWLEPCPVQLNAPYEGRLRDLVQITMRHAMKKGYRIESLSQRLFELVQAPLLASADGGPGHASGFAAYTLIQELILATQNLKYRLNDSLNGVARALAVLSDAPGAEARWHWSQHALLDGVMEIYESFTLADNAHKAFVDHYQQARGEGRHQRYGDLASRLESVFARV